MFKPEVFLFLLKGLRNGTMECLKNIDLATLSGAGQSKLPTCEHFKNVLFI